MRDQVNRIHPVMGLAPLAAAITDNTAQVSAIIDRRGYEALTFLIATGILADVDATFAVTMDHGDASNLSDAVAVPAASMIGTLANASFTFANDGVLRKIGYAGDKRYARLTITPAANTGNAPLAIVALLGHPVLAPTSNPPA
ncbi:MAG: hypothetical protein JWR10_3432 [Rubritepida sp.]|nr:hypothetical protein [Rubritepida sp.]